MAAALQIRIRLPLHQQKRRNERMHVRALSLVVVILLCAPALFAGELVPFRGTWSGSTVSAAPVDCCPPTVVDVVSAGTGNASHLGNFFMETPHRSHLLTLEITGTQIFTAANGDKLYADTPGFLAPNPDGSLEGTLHCTITGGTGRFEGATGSYDFHLVARANGTTGFDTEAEINGVISTPGSN
jgi:hypothetical protein